MVAGMAADTAADMAVVVKVVVVTVAEVTVAAGMVAVATAGVDTAVAGMAGAVVVAGGGWVVVGVVGVGAMAGAAVSSSFPGSRRMGQDRPSCREPIRIRRAPYLVPKPALEQIKPCVGYVLSPI